jgi:hypothetical protein
VFLPPDVFFNGLLRDRERNHAPAGVGAADKQVGGRDHAAAGVEALEALVA